MKKILLFLIFNFYSINTFAHTDHYNNLKKIEIEILRNGEIIGYNYYFFKNENKPKNRSNRNAVQRNQLPLSA